MNFSDCVVASHFPVQNEQHFAGKFPELCCSPSQQQTDQMTTQIQKQRKDRTEMRSYVCPLSGRQNKMCH